VHAENGAFSMMYSVVGVYPYISFLLVVVDLQMQEQHPSCSGADDGHKHSKKK
jgi:hypothetical protein